MSEFNENDLVAEFEAMQAEEQESRGETQSQFPELIPLTAPEADPVRPGILTGWLGKMATEVSNALEQPYDMAAALALAAVATAAQRRFAVNPEPGYFESVNIYAAAAMPPGGRKSAAQAAFAKPILDFEKAACAEHAAEVKRLTVRKTVIQSQIKAATEQAKQFSGDELDAALQTIDELEASLPEIPVAPIYLTQDTTPEHLGTMLSQQGEVLSLWSSEGGLFDTLAGRYNSGIANIDLVLQAYSGDFVRVHRGSRPAVTLNHPRLTIILCPQPAVLQKLANNEEFRRRGLNSRFVLVVPKSNLGYRKLVPTTISEDTLKTYREYIHSLLLIPPRDPERPDLNYIIKFSSEAYKRWKEFARAVELSMRPKGELDGMTDIGGKLPGQAARIAALLHIAENASNITNDLTVRLDCMERALELAATFMQHARHVFATMGLDEGLEIGRRLWEECVKLKQPAVTARDLWHPTRGKYPKMEDVTAGFDTLVERGWLIEQYDDNRGRGRPPRKFLVNPKALNIGHIGHRSEG